MIKLLFFLFLLFYIKKKCNLVTANQVYYLIYFLLVVFKYCFTILKKNIVMKKLFKKVYDYLSDILFGGESMIHY